MKVYISLPISGLPYQQQRDKADRVKAALSRAGYEPVNPFEIYAGENPQYADYLCSDLRELMDCEAIYLCAGWQYSKGCRIERFVGQECGLKIFYEE